MSGRKQKAQRRQKWSDAVTFLQAVMVEVRALYKRRAPEHFKRFPNGWRPCGTCAINPATDTWPGFDATAFGFFRSLQASAPFYCHRGMQTTPTAYIPQPEGERELCAAWGVVCGAPDLQAVLLRASVASRPALQKAAK